MHSERSTGQDHRDGPDEHAQVESGDGRERQKHRHDHELRHLSIQKLWMALAVNFIFLIVEVIGGLASNSLALLADAGHMLTDVAALLLAIIVAHLAEQVPTPKRTFGLLRAEVFGAFLNGAALVIIVGMIFREAWHRFGHLQVIDAPLMLVIAVLGLGANAGSAWILYGHRHENVNIKGAYLHMLADTLGSLGAIGAGAVIWLTGWTLIDPLVSVIIGVLILVGSINLISETVHILLEGTPEDVDYDEVKRALEDMEHIKEIHDLHIWTISSGVPSLSGHVRLYSECSDTMHWQSCLKKAQTMLRERFGIVHSTLQFEPEDYMRDKRII